MTRIIVSTPESGDWTVVEVLEDDVCTRLYEGHDRFSHLTLELVEFFGGRVEYYEYPDEEFEEKF